MYMHFVQVHYNTMCTTCNGNCKRIHEGYSLRGTTSLGGALIFFRYDIYIEGLPNAFPQLFLENKMRTSPNERVPRREYPTWYACAMYEVYAFTISLTWNACCVVMHLYKVNVHVCDAKNKEPTYYTQHPNIPSQILFFFSDHRKTEMCLMELCECFANNNVLLNVTLKQKICS